MIPEEFRWLVTRLDDPNSVLNDSRLEILREILIKKVAEYDVSERKKEV